MESYMDPKRQNVKERIDIKECGYRKRIEEIYKSETISKEWS